MVLSFSIFQAVSRMWGWNVGFFGMFGGWGRGVSIRAVTQKSSANEVSTDPIMPRYSTEDARHRRNKFGDIRGTQVGH